MATKPTIKRAKRKPWSGPTKYTGLSPDEVQFLNELADKGRLALPGSSLRFARPAPLSPVIGARRVKATVWHQDDFTIVRLIVADRTNKTHELIGVTKRNVHTDENDDARARKIALARAARCEAVQQ